jgi:hypothetical protein
MNRHPNDASEGRLLPETEQKADMKNLILLRRQRLPERRYGI